MSTDTESRFAHLLQPIRYVLEIGVAFFAIERTLSTSTTCHHILSQQYTTNSRYSTQILNSLYRALADNWNIDIARELEDYLVELEKISFSFDGEPNSLNFAEGNIVAFNYRY
jgi:hypothetical protein